MLKQNCLGYALNISGNDCTEVVTRTFEFKNLNVVRCFLAKLDELGYTGVYVSTENVLLKYNQTLLAFWGFFPYVEKALGYTSYGYDFHVAVKRQEKWMHKWGWTDSPEETSIEDLSKEYGTLPYFFVVQKKAP